MSKSEKLVQDSLVKALRSANSCEVEEEYCVAIGSNGYRIDVAMEDKQIAIECKAETSYGICIKGIGQCVRYEIDGWTSYLCLYNSMVDEDLKRACLRAGIGLITYTDRAMGQGKAGQFRIVVNNRTTLNPTQSGYMVRSDETIDALSILDTLGAESIDDILTLQNELRKLDPPDYPNYSSWKGRYEDGMKDNSFLPESN
jgi:hypothetical protein